MRLRPTQETKIILALAEIEAGDALAYRRLRLYTQSAFAVGLLLLGLAVFEAVNEPRAISAALTDIGAGMALALGLHFRLTLVKWPIVQRYPAEKLVAHAAPRSVPQPAQGSLL